MTTRGLPLGVDIGGSGIKGAPVDLSAGRLAAERFKVATPDPSTPVAVVAGIADVIDHFDDVQPDSPVGITVPGVVQHGVVKFVGNVDQAWVDTDADALFEEQLRRTVVVVNDADAAGIAEAHYGAARGVDGVVVVVTLGTGIGTALLHDGTLVPNTEFGHLPLDGVKAEALAAASVKTRQNLSWQQWAVRLQRYFVLLEKLLWPDLIVIGGGVSRDHEKFFPLLDLRTPILPAALENRAGIVGAAHVAAAAHDARES